MKYVIAGLVAGAMLGGGISGGILAVREPTLVIDQLMPMSICLVVAGAVLGAVSILSARKRKE